MAQSSMTPPETERRTYTAFGELVTIATPTGRRQLQRVCKHIPWEGRLARLNKRKTDMRAAIVPRKIQHTHPQECRMHAPRSRRTKK